MLTDIGTLPGSAAASTSIRRMISNGDVRGIVLRGTPQAIQRTAVNVVLRSTAGQERGTEQLIPNLPCVVLAEISDFRGGSSYGAVFAEQANADSSSETEDIPQCAVFIDLGNVKLMSGDELEATLTVTTAFAAGDLLQAALVEGPAAPENIRRFVERAGASQLVEKNVEEAYIYRLSAVDADDDSLFGLTAAQVTINLRIGQRSWTYDAQHAFSSTFALGEMEINAPRRTANVYDDPSCLNVSGDMALLLTGTDAANWNSVAVVRGVIPGRAERSAADFRAQTQAELTKVAQASPASYQTLVLGGRVPALELVGGLANVSMTRG